jgi:hypothetical protein
MSRAVGFGMRTLTKLVVGLLLLCCGAARAQNVETQWSFSAVNYANAQAACGAWAATLGAGYSALPPTLYGAKPDRVAGCNYTRPDNTTGGPNNVGVTEHCPAGATWNATLLSCVGSNPCAAKASQGQEMRFTVGWARSNTPNANDLVAPPTVPPNAGCDGTCAFTLGTVVEAWRSQVPAANGLHRITADYNTTFTGLQCTTQTPGTNPNDAPIPCPGLLGQVNGKPVCFGSPSTPLPQNPRPSATPPETHGNPPAGPRPATGAGSGGGTAATPASGNGGNAGGGSNAATPGGGSDGNGQGNGTPNGTNPDGSGVGGSGTSPIGDIEFPDTCGLPGKPPCKIDETGTHNGQGVYTSANSAWDAAKQAELDGLNSPTNKLQTVPWMWGFSLPTASCSVWHFTFKGHEYTVDVCGSSAANLWRSAWAWAVYVMGALYLWRRLTSAAPGGK